MVSVKTAILGAAVIGLGAGVRAQDPTPACASAEHRAFDFWVGEWNVHTPQGQLAGTSSVQRQYGGCVLHERYDTGRGYSGESLNTYSAPRKVWHQTWVDSSGQLLLLEGGLRDGRMVLEGQVTGADGTPARHGITWTPRRTEAFDSCGSRPTRTAGRRSSSTASTRASSRPESPAREEGVEVDRSPGDPRRGPRGSRMRVMGNGTLQVVRQSWLKGLDARARPRKNRSTTTSRRAACSGSGTFCGRGCGHSAGFCTRLRAAAS